MDKSIYDDLKIKYPELVGKGRFGGFAVGDGWYDIIDTLCGMITHRINQHNEDVAYRKAKIADGSKTEADYAGELMEEWKMPRIQQVKEKFGGLRFYINTTDKRIQSWVGFAECLSTKVCEECGAPGELRHGGWIRTLCDKHEEEHQIKMAERYAEYEEPSEPDPNEPPRRLSFGAMLAQMVKENGGTVDFPEFKE